MSDARLRELEKDAARGEPGAQVRLLVERMRTGGLTQERVELAAYCGDTAARMATGTLCPGGPDGGHTGFCDEQCGVYGSFPSWVRALSRWTDAGPVPGWVRVKAAVTAARAAQGPWWDTHKYALHSHSRGPDGVPEAPGACCYMPDQAIRTALAWLVDPTEANRLKCGRMVMSWAATIRPDDWWSQPVHMVDWAEAGHPERLIACACACAEIAGEERVRVAISAALIAWALS